MCVISNAIAITIIIIILQHPVTRFVRGPTIHIYSYYILLSLLVENITYSEMKLGENELVGH